jgi:8-oxo-dGTP diphosphatase
MSHIITPPESKFLPDSHCNYCGTRFTEQKLWPRRCFRCNNDSFKNPIPIVVSMFGVKMEDKVGIIIQQRNIEPEKGKWAFPSGYINHGESWEEAAVRENYEEMNITSSTDHYCLYGIRKPASGNMLIFCRMKKLWGDNTHQVIRDFIPNEEVTAMDIWYGDTELAFPTHNDLGQEFLSKLRNTQSPWTY